MDTRLVLFNHAGSGNHGCEAIVRGFMAGWKKENGGPVRLITNSEAQDRKYLSFNDIKIEEERHIDRAPIAHALYYGYRRITRDEECYQRYRFPMLLKKDQPEVAVSIGGDNYCYPEMVPDLILADEMLRKRGTRTVLLGCSIEPDSLREDPNRLFAIESPMVTDMREHSLITVRESVTYNALFEALVGDKRVRIKRLPDPAFAMEGEELPLPEGFEQGGTVGLNLSPLIERYRGEGGESALDAFLSLAGHIIKETDMNVALIPHVVWENNDDRRPLSVIYEKYRDTGRVVVIEDAPAPVLKGFIGRCRFFVGARTHATIAAYSSLVPTLVVGYSVKSRGIARDIFGTDEGLVVPVKSLTGAGLIAAFDQMREREAELKGVLDKKMPEIKREALLNAAEVKSLMEADEGA